MLRDQQVQDIADRLLSERLGRLGFVRSQVEARSDYYGEEALYVRAAVEAGSPVISGAAAGEAMVALRYALEEEGESRFPYLTFDYLGSERPHDEELDSVGS